MNWMIGILALGAVAAGRALDDQRRRQRHRIPRPEINRWEEEGGAVPASRAPNGASKRTHN
jgi:hypothetical protein